MVEARLDHVVLWVADPIRSLDFYQRVVGLAGVRVQEFGAGTAPFPSVRVSADSIIDLMPRSAATGMDAFPALAGSAGHPVNHVCLAMGERDFEALRSRLEAAGVPIAVTLGNSFGAQGHAPQTFYFPDPDGNVLEARHYAN